jgi:hypothetical protein
MVYRTARKGRHGVQSKPRAKPIFPVSNKIPALSPATLPNFWSTAEVLGHRYSMAGIPPRDGKFWQAFDANGQTL